MATNVHLRPGREVVRREVDPGGQKNWPQMDVGGLFGDVFGNF